MKLKNPIKTKPERQDDAELREEIKEARKKAIELGKTLAVKEEERRKLDSLIESLKYEILELEIYPFKDGQAVIYTKPLKSNAPAGQKCMISINMKSGSLDLVPFKKDGELSKNLYHVYVNEDGTYDGLFKPCDEEDDDKAIPFA